MAVTSWVARHTGLPSFHVTDGETVTAADGRVLTRGLREDVVSDALAQPREQLALALAAHARALPEGPGLHDGARAQVL